MGPGRGDRPGPVRILIRMDELPDWHTTGLHHADVVSIKQILAMEHAPRYDALRSYATHRRTSSLLGPMPLPICRLANQRLWLRTDVERWLAFGVPLWRRSRAVVRRAQGRI